MASTRRARRTVAALEQDLHAAVLGALAEHGYHGVTYEDVARRAQVSKPVLYRRYPTRSDMVLAAFAAQLQAAVVGEDSLITTAGSTTGSLRADLIAWFTLAQQRAATIGVDTYRGLVGEADPASVATITGLGSSATGLLRSRVIDPSVARGELGPTPLSDAIIAVPLRLLRDGLVFGDGFDDVAAMVDEVALPLYRGASSAGAADSAN